MSYQFRPPSMLLLKRALRRPRRTRAPIVRAVLALEGIRARLRRASRPGRLVDREAAAKQLGLSVRSFDRHAVPELPRVVVGTRVLYRPCDLDAWIDQHVVRPAGRR